MSLRFTLFNAKMLARGQHPRPLQDGSLLHVDEIVQHACHTCITVVSSGNTISSQSVPHCSSPVWNRAATVELLVVFYEQFHRKWLAMSGVNGMYF